MSTPKGNYGAPPKYINDFSKALAGEVRILLQEVGKLRDERRQLQHEIAELMAVKAKYSEGGEYGAAAGWLQRREPTPPPALPPPPPPDDGEPPAPVPPAWRTVHKRHPRERKPKALPAPVAAPPPAIEAAPPPNLPAWAQWRPNPNYTPQQQIASPMPAAAVPSSSGGRGGGLFGPPSPPPQ
ncbi:hypothetical protein PHLGIDRAFT_125282 [Phlebiopsis gigantea 11061_1 CR5-6]|uniref:Uncharacterized protein n=1 Tax=Phlebiopsis gigantea (strain 11061_1 CR5-6) TaxID=745531 RepID=A0A0C3SEQ9_PHLG1|nr:hypothetical protein PHLGIDRAFT_125282 [Phlebiopsis gigantea 11061_1 CR5-6]